jgi:hypothetical protein
LTAETYIRAYAPHLEDKALRRIHARAADLRKLQVGLDTILEEPETFLAAIALMIRLPDDRIGHITARDAKLPDQISDVLRDNPSFGERVSSQFFLTRAEAGSDVVITDIDVMPVPVAAHSIEGWVTWAEAYEVATPATLEARWASMLNAEERGFVEIDESILRLTKKGRNFVRSRAATLDAVPRDILEHVRIEADAIVDGRRSVEASSARLQEVTGLNISIAGASQEDAAAAPPKLAPPRSLATTKSWAQARRAILALRAPSSLWQPLALTFLDRVLEKDGASQGTRAIILECHPAVIDFAGASRSHGCMPLSEARDRSSSYDAPLQEAAQSFIAADLGLPVGI